MTQICFYQALMPWYGCVSVPECLSCFISTQTCKGSRPYHNVSAFCVLFLPFSYWAHQYKYTRDQTKQMKGNAPKQVNKSVVHFERTKSLPVCPDPSRWLLLIKPCSILQTGWELDINVLSINRNMCKHITSVKNKEAMKQDIMSLFLYCNTHH